MSVVHSLYRSFPLVSCFDAEAEAAEAARKAAEEAAAGKTSFSQDDVNKMLAEDRRKHKAALEKVEQNLQATLEKVNLTQQERDEVQANLAQVQSTLRTKDEQAKIDAKRIREEAEAKAKEIEDRATKWENRFKTNEIARSLQDAAVSAEAFRPDQIVALLRPSTKLIEIVDDKGKATGDYQATVELHDVDADGNATVTTRTPADAVKRMKELPDLYGNLFRSNVAAGIGAGNGAGGAGTGTVDVKKLNPAQYRELREKNPAALGLRPRR